MRVVVNVELRAIEVLLVASLPEPAARHFMRTHLAIDYRKLVALILESPLYASLLVKPHILEGFRVAAVAVALGVENVKFTRATVPFDEVELCGELVSLAMIGILGSIQGNLLAAVLNAGGALNVNVALSLEQMLT